MTDNVIEFPGETVGPIPPKKILDKANEEQLKDVVVLGWTEDNSLYISSSTGEAPDLIFLLEMAKAELIDMIRSD